VAMKNFGFLFMVVLFFSACDDDFKVGADYKEVTIVYGLLDHGSLTNEQYIKVTRGYYSETEDNLLLAANIDSIYYRDLDVKVEEYDNGNLTKTINCIRVDLASLPVPIRKESGVFADSPNYAYRFMEPLDANREYKLIVKNNESGSVITARTGIISTDPNIFTIIKPFTANDQLQFGEPLQTYTFSWKAPPKAELFDILLKFYYDDINLVSMDTVKKSVDLALGSFIPRNAGAMSFEMDNVVFYSLLSANIGAAPANIVRRVDTTQLFFVAGDTVVQKYIDVNNAQGGLTNDQIKPIYTNLSRDGVFEKDVVGIFGARSTRFVGNLVFDTKTYDTLYYSDKTRNLNFVGISLN